MTLIPRVAAIRTPAGIQFPLVLAMQLSVIFSSVGYADYTDKENAWELIWTYRRIHGKGKPTPGDLCLQNWGYSAKHKDGGNDYPFGFLFKSRADTDEELDIWQGGINLEVLASAEQRALGWHELGQKSNLLECILERLPG